jgi:hypothetical protein
MFSLSGMLSYLRGNIMLNHFLVNSQETKGFRSRSRVRSGQDRTGQDRTGQDRSGQVRSGQDRTGQVRSGQVRSGQVRSGQVRSGQVRSGQDEQVIFRQAGGQLKALKEKLLCREKILARRQKPIATLG